MSAAYRPPGDEGVVRSELVLASCDPQTDRLVLAATILGTSMAFIDGTVVNVALPALQRDLKATAAETEQPRASIMPSRAWLRCWRSASSASF